MNKLISLPLISAILALSLMPDIAFSQTISTKGTWAAVGNTEIRTRPASQNDIGDLEQDGSISIDAKCAYVDTIVEPDNGQYIDKSGHNDAGIGEKGSVCDANKDGEPKIKELVFPLGLTFTFNETMHSDHPEYIINTRVYSYLTSWISYHVQLFNLTKNKILASDGLHQFPSAPTDEERVKEINLRYKAIEADNGDVLQLRYILHKYDVLSANNIPWDNERRDFSIDSVTLIDPVTSNGGENFLPVDQIFLPKPKFDSPVTAPTTTEIDEMNEILDGMSNLILGTIAPTNDEVMNAITGYDIYDKNSVEVIEHVYGYLDQGIVATHEYVAGKPPMITGKPHAKFEHWAEASYLKVFTQYLKANPHNPNFGGYDIRKMAIETIWLFAEQFHSGLLPRDSNRYKYKYYAEPAVFLWPFLSEKQKNLFYYTLYVHTDDMLYIKSDEYKHGLLESYTKAIDMDEIGQISKVLLTFGLMQDKPDNALLWTTKSVTNGTQLLTELQSLWSNSLQWTKAFKRYYDRFLSYSPGTSDGLKPDGSSFHHFSALNNYTYNYKTPMEILPVLNATSFQVEVDSYKRLREAVYTQLFLANENVESLSMSGRHPWARHIAPASGSSATTCPVPPIIAAKEIPDFAIVGGKILQPLVDNPEPDPVLTGAYARMRNWWSCELTEFPFTQAEVLSGFVQFNYHNAGVYWKDKWLAVARGQSNWGFGAEISASQKLPFDNTGDNLFGRYQSYGALEIIYEGNQELGNGFILKGWDWNYNPGATTIVLPWDKLLTENKGQQEYQANGFTGALSLDNKNSPVLNKTHGTFGMFAMDFQESSENHGHDPITEENNHDPSFRFKKSVFFFNDYILSLGSNINRDDENDHTVTTLYQRSSKNPMTSTIIVNGKEKSGLYQGTSLTETNGNWIIDNFNTGYYIVGNNDDVIIKRTEQQAPYYNNADYMNLATADYSIGFIDHGLLPVTTNDVGDKVDVDASYEYVVKPKTNTVAMIAFEKLMTGSDSGISTKPYKVHQKDERAHIVSEGTNNITAYALFSANGVLSDGIIAHPLPNELLVISNNIPALIMYREIDDYNIRLSITNPDLGILKRDSVFSESVAIKVELKGDWTVLNQPDFSTPVHNGSDSTLFEFQLQQGMPIEVDLRISDADADGFNYLDTDRSVLDCNDNDNTVYPGAAEIAYDGIDQSCSGADLTDVDGDGFNYLNSDESILDCDDNNSAFNPEAIEIINDGRNNKTCDTASDFIVLIEKASIVKGGTLLVTAKSNKNDAANLSVDNYGNMEWITSKKGDYWKFSKKLERNEASPSVVFVRSQNLNADGAVSKQVTP